MKECEVNACVLLITRLSTIVPFPMFSMLLNPPGTVMLALIEIVALTISKNMHH